MMAKSPSDQDIHFSNHHILQSARGTRPWHPGPPMYLLGINQDSSTTISYQHNGCYV